MKKKVSVIGFGFSGLTAVWSLLRAGYEVEVFEKNDIPGGLIQTQKTEYGLVESAANAILRSKSVIEMANDFNIEWAEQKKTSKLKWIYTDKPRRWPLNFSETSKAFWGLINLGFSNPNYLPKKQETVEAWGKRIFGQTYFVDKLLGPALNGIYAQPPDVLSASLTLNPLFAKPRIKHDGSHAPKEGMSDFFKQGLLFFEKDKNFKLNLNASIDPADCPSDYVIDTRPNYDDVDYSELISVTLFFNESDRPKFKGFGCLFTKGCASNVHPTETLSSSLMATPFAGAFPDKGCASEAHLTGKIGCANNVHLTGSVLGVLFNSDIFSDRVPPGIFSEKWIVAKKYVSDEDTLSVVLKHRENKFNISAKPIFYSIKVWPKAIPIYSVKHENYLAYKFKKEELINSKKIIRISNYTGKIGLNKILEQNIDLPRQIQD